ncbi:hypothetical protein MJN76_32215, partial [Salmonella enterica subsp. enterica serovar Anatum]|nr:hypothetical protein [Salmonella enterica subsp. enterica serovar Anatum]
IDTKLPNGANYGFPVNTMHIVANKAWAEKNPAAAKLFAIMKLQQRLTPYQRGMYHGLSEMLEQVKAAMMRAGVEYQEGKNA